MSNTWASGFQTQREELTDVELAVEGSFPEWLTGTFISNGPGQFEVGDTQLEHWFDALAMLKRVRIGEGTVRYTNRFVRSDDFRVARDERRVRRALPGTPADGSGLRRLYQSLTGEFQDNPSIGVLKLDGDAYAVTESRCGIEIDPETLQTTGRRDLTAGLEADITLGHTHADGGTQWGLAADFGRTCAYTVFRRAPGEPPTELTRLAFDHRPPYVHAFALTEHYVVVPESSFGVDFRALLARTPLGGTFLDAFGPRGDSGAFHVLDRSTGERVAEIEAEPFLVYHFANAYERDAETIVVDCVKFTDEAAMTGLTVSNLRSDDPTLPRGDLVRFRLPLQGGRAREEQLVEGPCEFPTINYGYNGRRYEYAYLAVTDRGSLPTGIAKVAVDEPTVREWSEPGLHPGEAIFVSAPSASAEDEGVLLSLALDGANDRSVVLCLDATTLEERGRAARPHRDEPRIDRVSRTITV
ncbi:beta-carotene 15,15'-monooxygenase [Halobacteriales archaeon QH_10_67_13]|nr:MAG: beta-carotene 15,15'-monooxygenase [Halobacteriales archaeon QH_10_67_13]